MNYNKKILSLLAILSIFLILIFVKDTRNNDIQAVTVLEKISNSIKVEIGSVSIQTKENANFTWIKDGYNILVPADDSYLYK